MNANERTTQSTTNVPATGRTGAPWYEIRVSGHLEPRWTAWFDGLRITTEDDGVTLISGPVVDQSALHGLLAKLRDLGIDLVSLVQFPTGEPNELSNLDNIASSPNPTGATP